MIYIVITILVILVILCYGLIPSNYLKKKRRINRHPHGKKIYLTFDDGPSREYTPLLLDLLEKYNVKATFFVVANYAKDNKDIINRMKKEGHEIALHSLKHKSELLELPHETINSIKKSINILKDLNVNIRYFRAPWGQFNVVGLILLRKYKICLKLWDVMAEDWELNTTSDIIYNKLITRIQSGDIICLHDGRGECHESPKRMIEALNKAIPKLIEKGYEFEVIDE